MAAQLHQVVPNALAALIAGTLAAALWFDAAPRIAEPRIGIPALQMPVLSPAVLLDAIQPALIGIPALQTPVFRLPYFWMPSSRP